MPNSFYEIRNSLILKSNKNKMRRKCLGAISLINRYKNQSKILETVSSNVFKATICHMLVGFISRIRNGSTLNILSIHFIINFKILPIYF